MARRRSSSSAPSRPAPARTPTPPQRQPVPVQSAPPPVPVQPQQPGLFAQMASTAAGVAVGSTVGHTLGHAITGAFSGGSAPAPVQQQEQPQQVVAGGNPCELDGKAFYRCLEQNNQDISACQVYYDMYKQCMQMSSGTFQ